MSPNKTDCVAAHVIPYVGRQFGGPVMALASMVNGLSAIGFSSYVFSIHQPNEGELVDFISTANVFAADDMSLGGLRHSSSLWSHLRSAQPSIIHSHGLWTDVHRAAANVAQKKKIPHVLGPCGMLEPNALKRSSWKKHLALNFFQRRALQEASCLLANSEKEYVDIRQFGLINPVAIVPNPVPGPLEIQYPNDKELFDSYPILNKKKNLLYLGRIHPVKGLKRLIQAWVQLKLYHDEWQLVLAGPDEGGYQKELARQIEEVSCQDSIHFIGSLDERWKWTFLNCSDLFVMPSDFENFGIAVAEALIAGKPVITTTGTPWKCLTERNAGWWVDAHPNALKAAIQSGMKLADQQRQVMGENGKKIAEQFQPETVAKQLISLYKWLLSESQMPSFVRLD